MIKQEKGLSPSLPERREKVSFITVRKNTIIKCTNPVCLATFSIIVYAFSDKECTKINAAEMIPLTGNTPFHCPVCGKNLGK